MNRQHYYIYIMTNKINTVFYTGITSNLPKRIYEHKNKIIEGFTKRYNITKFLYYEIFDNPEAAIQREKQIKGGSRKKKIYLIKNINPEFKDLSDSL
ncbi:MAG: GIY-YIG nuclease family protein [Parcubacteria group bacterium]|nr:GIY-YIG nuclease family protein [Parcubacteria group bacterium]